MKTAYEDADEWYEELRRIAKRHNNLAGIRDRDSWVAGWARKSPSDAYYEEYPEHTP
jgi:hypothetical protein